MTSSLEWTLLRQIEWAKLPEPQLEYRFQPPRRWRFDFAWPDRFIAVEVEGGTRSGGRHVRGNGYADDCLKYNEAALCDWLVLRFTGQQVLDGVALQTIERAMNLDPA